MSTKRKGMGAGIFLLFLCLLSAGCVHDSTTAKCDASFLPYVHAKVGQVSLREFLIVRSAALIAGDQLSGTASGTNSHILWIKGTISALGSAAAIDRRGYFLTAAHCVKKGPVMLVFLKNGHMEAQPVRVVWCGDTSKKQPDLAILRVSLPLQDVFEWTPEFTNGDSIVAVGFSPAPTRLMNLQFKAGKVLRLARKSEAVFPHYMCISHDAPLRHGDSGGPLASIDGHLVGINVSFEADLQWKSLSLEPVSGNAQRPDLEWLRQLIGQDVALQSGAAINQPNERAGGDGRMKPGS